MIAADDAGLQRERTQLAWARTVLSSAVVALIVTRIAIDRGDFLQWIAVGALPTTATLLATGLARTVRLRSKEPVAPMSAAAAASVVGALVANSLVALVLVLD